MTEPSDTDLEYRPVWARTADRKAAGRRGPSFKGLILNLISLALVVAAVSFFAAPGVAFFAIRSAAQSGDIAGLARLIDFDAVRASLRPQISGRVEPMTPAPSFMQDPIGAVRRQFEQSMAAPVPNTPPADAYLGPAALLALTDGAGRDALNPAQTSVPQGHHPFPRPTYWSVNRVRMSVVDQNQAATAFTFERRGPFEWKLVHIGLPPQVPGA